MKPPNKHAMRGEAGAGLRFKGWRGRLAPPEEAAGGEVRGRVRRVATGRGVGGIMVMGETFPHKIPFNSCLMAN